MRSLIPAAADLGDFLPDVPAPRYAPDDRMTRAQKAQLRGARQDLDASEKAAARALR